MASGTSARTGGTSRPPVNQNSTKFFVPDTIKPVNQIRQPQRQKMVQHSAVSILPEETLKDSFYSPRPPWENPKKALPYKTILLTITAVIALYPLLMVGTGYGAQLKQTLFDKPFVPSQQMSIRATSITYDPTSDEFTIEGETTFPKGTYLGYELRSTEKTDIPLSYRAAIETQKNNRFSLTIPAQTFPDTQTLYLKIAFDLTWQPPGWPSEEVLGINQQWFTGPEVYLNEKTNKKQVIMEIPISKISYFD